MIPDLSRASTSSDRLLCFSRGESNWWLGILMSFVKYDMPSPLPYNVNRLFFFCQRKRLKFQLSLFKWFSSIRFYLFLFRFISENLKPVSANKWLPHDTRMKAKTHELKLCLYVLTIIVKIKKIFAKTIEKLFCFANWLKLRVSFWTASVVVICLTHFNYCQQGLFQGGPEGRSAWATEIRGQQCRKVLLKIYGVDLFFFFWSSKFFWVFLYKEQQNFFSARATRGLKEPLTVKE